MTTKKPADQAAELRDSAREVFEDAAEKMSDVQARAAQGLEIGAAKAQQVGKAAQEATTQVKDSANRALDQAEKKIDDLPDAVREPAHRTVNVLRQRPALVLFGLVGLFALWRLLSRRNQD